jgi:hypothetical protein
MGEGSFREYDVVAFHAKQADTSTWHPYSRDPFDLDGTRSSNHMRLQSFNRGPEKES